MFSFYKKAIILFVSILIAGCAYKNNNDYLSECGQNSICSYSSMITEPMYNDSDLVNPIYSLFVKDKDVLSFQQVLEIYINSSSNDFRDMSQLEQTISFIKEDIDARKRFNSILSLNKIPNIDDFKTAELKYLSYEVLHLHQYLVENRRQYYILTSSFREKAELNPLLDNIRIRYSELINSLIKIRNNLNDDILYEEKLFKYFTEIKRELNY